MASFSTPMNFYTCLSLCLDKQKVGWPSASAFNHRSCTIFHVISDTNLKQVQGKGRDFVAASLVCFVCVLKWEIQCENMTGVCLVLVSLPLSVQLPLRWEAHVSLCTHVHVVAGTLHQQRCVFVLRAKVRNISRILQTSSSPARLRSTHRCVEKHSRWRHLNFRGSSSSYSSSVMSCCYHFTTRWVSHVRRWR